MTNAWRESAQLGLEMGPQLYVVGDTPDPTMPSAENAEGFSLSYEDLQAELEKELAPISEEADNPFYAPIPGTITPEKVKELEQGNVHIGTYFSERATHRVGIYMPNDFDPKAGKPVVLMTSPLGTGARGHNQEVATQMMERGFAVIFKGPPRYYKPTLKALTLAEDANEMLSLVDAVEEAGLLGEIQELVLYGESQAAMKLLMVLAIKGEFCRETVASMPVAACYLKQINWRRPHRQALRLAGMGTGAIRVARSSTRERLEKLRGTFAIKDLHHHAIVIPVLISGETGTALDYIDPHEEVTPVLFGKDGYSKPRRAQAEYESRFPKANVLFYPQYGHVDGIMSHETRVQRELMLYEVAKRFDMRGTVELEELVETELV